nr:MULTISPECIES: GAF domain-containing sensor histidine kinase [Cyanophyceae]
MLKRITDKVRDSLDESQILTTVVRELALGLEVDGCDTALYDLEQGTSTVYYEYCPSLPSKQGSVLLITDHLELHNQFLQGQSLQFCLLSSSPVWLGQNRSIFGCPISDEHGVLGDLWLYTHPNYIFSDPEIRLVQQISNQCAIAIRQARLYQAAQVQVENLEKLNQLKDDFLSTVSHELRAPMANIKMAIHMLKVPSTQEQRERYLKILETECKRETELINNLLDLQQLEADALPLSFETLHLQNWLPSVIEPFQVRASECQQSLIFNWSGNLPPLFSHPPSLERILVELLNNACKYTAAGGKIALNVIHAPYSGDNLSNSLSAIVFTIGNQSEIPVAELPYIFDKFYRIPQADPWQQRGTGLGLALVQKLVERLAGSIEVTSNNEWTEFTLRFFGNQS